MRKRDLEELTVVLYVRIFALEGALRRIRDLPPAAATQSRAIALEVIGEEESEPLGEGRSSR